MRRTLTILFLAMVAAFNNFSAIAQRNDAIEKSVDSSNIKRLALVIGNGDYKHVARLDNARNDAKDMCQALGKLGFETLCYENQHTKRQMKDAVIGFSQKLAGGNLVSLVFYAGHGIQVKGENYLLPTDVELRTEADIDDEALSVGYLMAQLENSKNSFNIVILDACRNNPLARAWRSAGGGGLAPIDAPVGSIIIFSTAPGKVASDGGGRNGLFTKHLLANLEMPGLPLEEMVKNVSRSVMEESKNYGMVQSPWWNSSFTGTFCFGGCKLPTQDNNLTRIKLERDQFEKTTKLLEAENQQRKKRLFDMEQEKVESERMLQLERQKKSSQPQTQPQTQPFVNIPPAL